jgi:hypothetical protein
MICSARKGALRYIKVHRQVGLRLAEFSAYDSKQLADQALTHVTNSLA